MKGLAANRKKPVLKPIDRVFIRKTEKGSREHMTESQLVGACEDPIKGQLYMPCSHFHYYNLGNGALIPL